MGDGIYCALSGALAQQTALDTTATNLANASVAGFHAQTPIFREVLKQAGPMGTLRFAEVQATAITTTAGALRSTGRALDVALPEKVFLAVQSDAGERYTRDGSLEVKADGTLVTKGGQPVLSDQGASIKVPPGAAPRLRSNGEIVGEDGPIGRLKLVTFAEPAWLAHEGATLAATNDSGQATASAAEISVGTLEDSNSSPVTAMTQLLTASRMFDAFQKAIETFHEADRRVATTTPGNG